MPDVYGNPTPDDYTSPNPAVVTGAAMQPPPGQPMPVDQIKQAAWNAGFRGDDLNHATAIAMSETSQGRNLVNNNEGSYGLWQVHHSAHPQYDTNQLVSDPQYSANAAYDIYKNAGNTFRDWTTYKPNDPRYQANLAAARALPTPTDTPQTPTGPTTAPGNVMQPGYTTPQAEATAQLPGQQAGLPAVTATGPNAPALGENAGDVGAAAATNPALGPVLSRARPFMQRPGNYQQAPSYMQASTDPTTGLPTAAGPQTKLGKLLSILRGAAMGAAAGSTQPTFGTGFLAANQFLDENARQNLAMQQGGVNLALGRENLQYMPLQRAWQLSNMQQNALLNRQYQEARTEEIRQRSAMEAQRAQTYQTKPINVNGRWMRPAMASDDPSKIDPSGYVDIGEAPPKGTPQERAINYLIDQKGVAPDEAYRSVMQTQQDIKNLTPEQQGYQAAHDALKAKGMSEPDIYNALKTGQPTGAGTEDVPLTDQEKQRIGTLPGEVQSRLGNLPTGVQAALLALADGDAPASSWSARGTYKNLGGLTQAQAIAWARTINPNWNAGLYGNVNKVRQDYLNPRGTGGQIEAFNTFLNHASDAKDAVDTIQQTNSPLLNRPLNWLRTHAWTDPAVQQYWAALEPVRKEFMSVLNAGRGESQIDQQEMAKILDDNASPAAVRGVLGTLGHAAVRRLDSVNENYRTASNGSNWPNLVYPMARQSAMNIGLGREISKYGSGGAMPGYAAPAAQQAPPPGQAAPAAKPPAGTVFGKAQKYGGVAIPRQNQ